MAISFVAVGSRDDPVDTGANGVNPVPPTHQTDDLLIALCTRTQYNQTWDAAPTGWTLLMEEDDSYGDNPWSVGVYYKIATSGSESTPNFTHSEPSVSLKMCAHILNYRGVDTTTPIDVTYASGSHYVPRSNVPSTNDDVPKSITTATDNAWVLVLEWVSGNNITSNADPSGYTNDLRWVGASANNEQQQVWHKEVATAGSESPGVPAYTSDDTTQDGFYLTIALRPGAGGTSIPIFQNYYRQQV